MGVYEECSRSRRSGTNDADVLRLATTRYQDDGNQGKVPIDLWRILSRSPKWQQLNNPDGGPFRTDGGSFWKRSTVDAEVEVDKTIGSTDQIPPFNVADSDDEDPIPRPIGRKKAKSIASGSGGSASVSASPRDEIGRAMIEQLRAFISKNKRVPDFINSKLSSSAASVLSFFLGHMQLLSRPYAA
ncbi:unnamed protein product [Cuscuta campestris]|uniref:No apical meristem-associated C-terminal domain-containing protein n=1 Tax=Cuscuta campestris TaxID=132261 RepID=A0A484MYA0_9ASTE|nr:unnamed protein product [Cuscuta campestris]